MKQTSQTEKKLAHNLYTQTVQDEEEDRSSGGGTADSGDIKNKQEATDPMQKLEMETDHDPKDMSIESLFAQKVEELQQSTQKKPTSQKERPM